MTAPDGSNSDPIAIYHQQAAALAAAYESQSFEGIHSAARHWLPEPPALILDVGAGSGRDAAWFARQGHEVVAVEPARKRRELAPRLHADGRIRWFDDRLPGLPTVSRLRLHFGLIWLSAVWMHVPPGDRVPAFHTLMTLLTPGGRLVFTLRCGPAPVGRPMYPVAIEELLRLGDAHGFQPRLTAEQPDFLGRPAVRWQTVGLERARR